MQKTRHRTRCRKRVTECGATATDHLAPEPEVLLLGAAARLTSGPRTAHVTHVEIANGTHT
eukprot:1612254-Rhodomonas_salina.1